MQVLEDCDPVGIEIPEDVFDLAPEPPFVESLHFMSGSSSMTTRTFLYSIRAYTAIHFE
ncbi:MAG: hypothetical protein ACLFRY_01950 [Spirochaetia bacterium]